MSLKIKSKPQNNYIIAISIKKSIRILKIVYIDLGNSEFKKEIANPKMPVR